MVYHILCHNNQDGKGQELYTLDQVSYEVGIWKDVYFFIKMFIKR